MDNNMGRAEGSETIYINFNITFKDPEDLPIKIACLPEIKFPDFLKLIRDTMVHRMKNYIEIKFQGLDGEEKILTELNEKLTQEVSTHFNTHKDYKAFVTLNLDINLEFIQKKTFVLKVFSLKNEEKDKKESISPVDKFVKKFNIEFASEFIIEFLNDYQIQTKIINQYLVVATDENFMEKVVDNANDIDIILFWTDSKNETAKKFNSQSKKATGMKLGLLLSTVNLKIGK